MLIGKVSSNDNSIDIQLGNELLTCVPLVSDETIKTQNLIEDKRYFKVLDSRSGKVFLLKPESLCDSYRITHAEALSNAEILERLSKLARSTGWWQDPSSFQKAFSSFPKRITSKLDRDLQKLKEQRNVYPSSIVEIIGQISILPCDKQAKLELIEQIYTRFDTTGEIRNNTKKIVEDILKDEDKTLYQILDHKSSKWWLDVEKFIQNMEEGWVKERLKRALLESYSPAHYSHRYYESVLAQSHIYGANLSFSEFFTKTGQSENVDENWCRSVFQLVLSNLYEHVNIGPKKIIVSGEVSSDGLGDYFQMWQAAKILKDHLADAAVSVAVRYRSAPQVSREYSHVEDLAYFSPEEIQSKQIEKRLKEADCLVIVSHGIGSTPNPGKIPVITVNEYGFGAHEGFAFGLSHALDNKILGIPLAQVNHAASVESLTDRALRERLLMKKRPFYLGYLKKDQISQEQARCGFVQAVAVMQKDNVDDVDIICTMESLDQLDIDVLRKYGVGKVVLMKRDEGGRLSEKESLQVAASGKEICILNPFPIPNDDMKVLLKFSQPLVGCTGDVSISEVLANRKIPFYQIRWHKAEFFSQLYHFAREEGLNKVCELLDLYEVALREGEKEISPADFTEYFVQIGQKCTPECAAEFETLADRVVKYYTKNTLLVERLKRFFLYRECPTLKSIEEEAVKKWLSGELDLSEAYQSVISAYHKIGR